MKNQKIYALETSNFDLAHAKFLESISPYLDKVNLLEIFNPRRKSLANGAKEILLDNLSFSALCKDHLVPFFGNCSLTIAPTSSVLGVSAYREFISEASRGLWYQEELTHHIASSLKEILEAKSVRVVLSAQHACSILKDTSQPASVMETVAEA